MWKLVRLGSVALVLAAMLVPTQTLQAQERKGNWIIFPRISYQSWDNAAAVQDPVLSSSNCDYPQFGQDCSAIWNNFTAGISLLYGVAGQFSVGLAFDAGRPISNGAYFPATSLESAGVQKLTFVNMRMTVVQYQVAAEWAPALGGLRPYVSGGIGGYTVFPEAKKLDQAGVTGSQKFTDLMFSVGLGLDIAMGGTSGFRIQVVDNIYTGWDRDKLSPALPAFQTNLFPDLVPAPPSASSTLNNFALSIGFVFIP